MSQYLLFDGSKEITLLILHAEVIQLKAIQMDKAAHPRQNAKAARAEFAKQHKTQRFMD